MNCPNCGTGNYEGVAFCAVCGTDLRGVQMPYQPNQPYMQARRQPPMSKKAYIKSDETAGRKAKMIVLTMLVSVALIIASIVGMMSTHFLDIPIFGFIFESIDEMDEMEDDLERIALDAEDLEYCLDSEDELSKSEKKIVKEMCDSAEELADTFSMLNVFGFMADADNVIELMEEYGEGRRAEELSEDMAELMSIMSIFAGVLIAFFVLPILLTVLGGVTKNTVVVVVAMVLTTIVQAAFCGLLWVALTVVVGVFQAVQCSGLKKQYNEYCMGNLAY
jgi:uncharacterized Zn finger protein (UPF0148 family)